MRLLRRCGAQRASADRDIAAAAASAAAAAAAAAARVGERVCCICARHSVSKMGEGGGWGGIGG